MKINNYIVIKNKEEIVLLINQNDILTFKMIKAKVYIKSNKLYLKELLDIRKIEFVDFKKEHIDDLNKIKKLTITLLDDDQEIVDGYEFNL